MPRAGDHPELAHRGDRRGGQAAEAGGRGDGCQHHRDANRAEAGNRGGEPAVPVRMRAGVIPGAAAGGGQQVGGEDVHAVGAAQGHHERRRGHAHDGEVEPQDTHRAHRPHGGDGDHQYRQDHGGQRTEAHVVGRHDHRHRHHQQQRQVAGQVVAGGGVDGRHAGQRNLDPRIAQRLHGVLDGGQQRAVVGAQRYVEQHAQGGAVVGNHQPARQRVGREALPEPFDGGGVNRGGSARCGGLEQQPPAGAHVRDEPVRVDDGGHLRPRLDPLDGAAQRRQ